MLYQGSIFNNCHIWLIITTTNPSIVDGLILKWNQLHTMSFLSIYAINLRCLDLNPILWMLVCA